MLYRRLNQLALPLLAGLILICPLTLPVNAAEKSNSLIELLGAGGYTIYFRHERTDWSQSDNIRKHGDWTSCDPDRVRQLSAEGRQRASATGRAIRQLGIPIGRVIASPYCRTMETAKHMALGPVEPSEMVINMRVSDYFGGRQAIIRTARQLIGTRPNQGSNTIIVAHGNVAQAATPAYPGEGEGVVFKADGKGGFSLVGRLTADKWRELAR